MFGLWGSTYGRLQADGLPPRAPDGLFFGLDWHDFLFRLLEFLSGSAVLRFGYELRVRTRDLWVRTRGRQELNLGPPPRALIIFVTPFAPDTS